MIENTDSVSGYPSPDLFLGKSYYQTLSDDALVQKVKDDNCSDCLLELYNRHVKMLNGTTKKYARVTNCTGISHQDFNNEGLFIVYKAAQKFDNTKNTKFSTFLTNRARYFCLDTIKENRQYLATPPLERDCENGHPMAIAENQSLDENLTNDADYIFYILDELKDKRVKYIIKQRYFAENRTDRSYKKIADALGLSHQGVLEIHNHFIKFIRTKLAAKTNQDLI